MTNATVGALRVSLGIDTAQFQNGLKNATRSLAAVGKSMQATGQSLTKNLTAPILAAGSVLGVGLGKLASDLETLGNRASIAGTAAEDLQRFAFAARSVGIDGDKLADILKDVNDKIGDFRSTGAGQMADFFENIAPKVGLTVDAFEGLSGADSLQLYVSSLEKANVSQAEMTFYLEAIASDATALLPILRDNGTELERLGQNATVFDAGAIDAARGFQEAMRNLGAALSSVGAALVDAGLLDKLAGLVDSLAGWIRQISEVNPKIIQFTAIVAGLAAALGPALVGLGLVAVAVSGIAAPIAIAVAGIAALAAAAAAFWPEIMAAKDAVISFGRDALDWIKSKPAEIAEAFRAVVADMKQIGLDIIGGLWDGLRERWETVRSGITGFASGIANIFRTETQTQSPSRVMMDVGRDIMAGLGLGLKAEQAGIETGLQSFASGIARTFEDILTGTASFKDGFRSLLAQSLGQAGSGLINAGIGGILGGLKIPGFANGTRFAPGGLAWVGERGPELVNLPRGSQVIPNNATGQMGRVEVILGPGLEARVLDGARSDAVKITRTALESYDRTLPDRLAGINRDPWRRG